VQVVPVYELFGWPHSKIVNIDSVLAPSFGPRVAHSGIPDVWSNTYQEKIVSEKWKNKQSLNLLFLEDPKIRMRTSQIYAFTGQHP
jgi:hypothetical protein